MKKVLRVLSLCFALTLLTVPARADICDDINDLSNVWNDIANFLHQHEDEGFSPEDVDQLGELVGAALEPTEILGKALAESEDENEQQLGQNLLWYAGELRSTSRDDLVSYIVDVMDDITDSLDAVTDYCDNI